MIAQQAKKASVMIMFLIVCLMLGAALLQTLVEYGVSTASADPVRALADPVTDTGAFSDDVRGAFKDSRWTFLVVLCLFGLSRVLIWAAGKWSIAWLKRWTPALVTASGVLAALGASLESAGSIDWQATIGAVLAAVALYLRPEPKPAGGGL